MDSSVPPNVYEISESLSKEYGDNNHYNKEDPLDELLFIICSSKTNEALYRKAYSNLRREFSTHKDISNATQKDIAEAIKVGGLSNQKSRAIKNIMEQLIEDFGRPTLLPLKKMDDDECENYLLSLPQVGKKTARCVMMYSLGRSVFPVDTHCWRIARRLGWVEKEGSDNTCRQKDMDRLQSLIPQEKRYTLHVNLVSHGRKCCTPTSPECNSCPINEYCPMIGVE